MRLILVENKYEYMEKKNNDQKSVIQWLQEGVGDREAPELMATLFRKFNNFRYFGYHTIA